MPFRRNKMKIICRWRRRRMLYELTSGAKHIVSCDYVLSAAFTSNFSILSMRAIQNTHTMYEEAAMMMTTTTLAMKWWNRFNGTKQKLPKHTPCTSAQLCSGGKLSNCNSLKSALFAILSHHRHAKWKSKQRRTDAGDGSPLEYRYAPVKIADIRAKLR